jgi:hypothetical protein
VYGYTLASARDVSATRFTTQSLETGVSFASSSRFFRNLTGSNVFNARFIGDYTNIALDRDNHVWATWTDMRAPVDPFFAIDTGTNGPPVLHAEHAVAATR